MYKIIFFCDIYMTFFQFYKSVLLLIIQRRRSYGEFALIENDLLTNVYHWSILSKECQTITFFTADIVTQWYLIIAEGNEPKQDLV